MPYDYGYTRTYGAMQPPATEMPPPPATEMGTTRPVTELGGTKPAPITNPVPTGTYGDLGLPDFEDLQRRIRERLAGLATTNPEGAQPALQTASTTAASGLSSAGSMTAPAPTPAAAPAPAPNVAPPPPATERTVAPPAPATEMGTTRPVTEMPGTKPAPTPTIPTPATPQPIPMPMPGPVPYGPGGGTIQPMPGGTIQPMPMPGGFAGPDLSALERVRGLTQNLPDFNTLRSRMPTTTQAYTPDLAALQQQRQQLFSPETAQLIASLMARR